MTDIIAALDARLPGNPVDRAVSDRYRGDWLMQADASVTPLGVARPRTTADVATILSYCNDHRIAVIPQGGQTGLTGGVVPQTGSLILSMERMNRIESIDPTSQIMTVEAGVPLEAIQQAADAAGLMFPLDIGSRGSCQIGGNLSTNAGGNRVLRYGMARAMVLGLEVVLADGTILSGMNRMLKNNAGYDLKQLFIGSEGTLGVITRAVLRLSPRPRTMATALLAFDDYAAVEAYLALARDHLGDSLSAFEVMWRSFYQAAVPLTGVAPPLLATHAAYVITEISSSSDRAEDDLSACLDAAFAQGLAADGVLAQSVQQTRSIWSVRDMGGELIRRFDPVGNFDISVPTSGIPAFVEDCSARVAARWPNSQPIWFGHVCDGNVHFVIGGFPPDELEALELCVYEAIRDHGGSISAEHGIGLHKKDHLSLVRNEAEIAAMRRLKVAFDPHAILNPGKVLV